MADEDEEVIGEIVMADVLCGHCGMLYMVPEAWLDDKKRTHDTFYCPNGQSRWYPPAQPAPPQKSEVEEEGAWAWLTRAFRGKTDA